MLSSNVKTFNDEIQQNQDENSINFTKTNASKQLSFSVDRILSMERSNDVIYRHDVNESQTIIRPTPMRFIAPNQSSITVSAISTQQHFYRYLNSCESMRSLSPFAMAISSTASSSSSVAINHISAAPINTAASMSSSNGKRKRSWSRAVFSQLQRKGLEIQFQIQKYITKPDRRKLAARLGLTDAQVKVWFQNRRMKWRHTRAAKLNSGKKIRTKTETETVNTIIHENVNTTSCDEGIDSSDDSEDSEYDDEIDVVTE